MYTYGEIIKFLYMYVSFYCSQNGLLYKFVYTYICMCMYDFYGRWIKLLSKINIRFGRSKYARSHVERIFSIKQMFCALQ